MSPNFDIKLNVMKTLIIPIIVLLSSALALPEVSLQTNDAQSTMSILGTSTLHDWEMKAKDLNGSMEVDIYSDSLHVKDIALIVPVKSLKSGKSAMDRNAYEALKSDDHPKIKYEFISVSNQQKTGPNTYKLKTRGKLTVAGKTRTLNIPVTATKVKNGLELSGTTTFDMSSFNVEPPSFAFGTVSTGDEITIEFSINYN